MLLAEIEDPSQKSVHPKTQPLSHQSEQCPKIISASVLHLYLEETHFLFPECQSIPMFYLLHLESEQVGRLLACKTTPNAPVLSTDQTANHLIMYVVIVSASAWLQKINKDTNAVGTLPMTF